MLALLLLLKLNSDAPAHVHARTAASPEAVAVAPATPSLRSAPEVAPEPAPVVEPEVTPAVAVSQATSSSETLAPTAPVISEPPVVTEAIVTNVAPVSLPPKEAAPAFRLNGIIYGVANPSATVNGKTVFVGERVNGATVISIGRNEVTLEINGERKTVSLPGVR